MKRGRIDLLDRGTAALVSTLLKAVSLMPEGLAYGFASSLGSLFWALSSKRRAWALEHITLALGEKRKDRVSLAKESFSLLAKVALDYIHLTKHLDRGTLLNRVEFQGLEESLDQTGPGGVIFVTGHLGNWEVGGITYAMVKKELHVIARRIDNPYLDRLLLKQRERAGLQVHPRRGGFKPLARALEEGKDVAMLIDQNQRKRGLFVPVFGRLASTDRSAAVLSFRFDRPLVTSYALRMGRGFKFKVVFNSPLRPTKRERSERDLEGLTGRVVQELSKAIEAHPGQYLWVHRRYRTRPPESKGE